MEYLIIFILQILGIVLSVAKKLYEIDLRHPDDSFSDVLSVFMNKDRITLIISGAILALNLVLHFILDYYPNSLVLMENYELYAFGVALVLGYGGQSIVYKFLGKAEAALISRADKIN